MTNTPNRRKFLAAAAGTAALPLAAPAYAQGKRTLRMATGWPKNFPGLGTGANKLAGMFIENFKKYMHNGDDFDYTQAGPRV